jgi:hypothetical protein
MRQTNVVTGPLLAALGLVLLVAAPALGQQGCLVGSFTTGACGTGGTMMTAVGAMLGLLFLLSGYVTFSRGLAG